MFTGFPSVSGVVVAAAAAAVGGLLPGRVHFHLLLWVVPVVSGLDKAFVIISGDAGTGNLSWLEPPAEGLCSSTKGAKDVVGPREARRLCAAKKA